MPVLAPSGAACSIPTQSVALTRVQTNLGSPNRLLRRGAQMLDSWESHFREKSRRRSKKKISPRAVAGWMLAAAGFLVCVVALLEAVQV